MTNTTRALAATLLATTALATACSTQPAQPSQPQQTTTTTTTPKSTTPQTTTDTTGEPQPACDTTRTNPLASYNKPIQTTPLPETQEISYFHYEVTESHYDPCAPISWVIISGTLGTETQPGATAGSSYQTVIYFTHGDYATQQPPILATTVDAVTPTSDTTIAASFNVNEGPRAAGKQTLKTNKYELNGKELTITQDETATAQETLPSLDLAQLATDTSQ